MHWRTCTHVGTCTETSTQIISHTVAIYMRYWQNWIHHLNCPRLQNFIFLVSIVNSIKFHCIQIFLGNYNFLSQIWDQSHQYWLYRLFRSEFGSAENVVEPITNKYYTYAGPWEFASNSSMHSIEVFYLFDLLNIHFNFFFKFILITFVFSTKMFSRHSPKTVNHWDMC